MPLSKLSVGKKFLFALLVTVSFFVFLETVLALFGWRPVIENQDPFVGFAANSRLFVESKAKDGTLEYATANNKLRWFNQQTFPAKKSAQTVRIFCLGGSTTYGHPYDDQTSFGGWLRVLLPLVDKSKTWEVINCGGISYASYRVANLLPELLEYQPDLFVVYTGHNEFLEARSYEKLARTPPFILQMGSLASRSRLYAVYARCFRTLHPTNVKSGNQTGDLLPEEVDTLLDSSVGLEVYHRDDRYRDRVFEHFELNLQRIAHMANQHGVPVVFITPASNIGACSPFKSEVHQDLIGLARSEWTTAFEQAQQAFAVQNYAPALAQINRAIELDDRHAGCYYLRGRILQEMHQYPRAKRDYLKARDEDVCALRASQAIIDIVRRTTREKNVPLVDFVNWVDENSESGISGDKLFLDHVHGTIDAYRHLAELLVHTLKEMGIARPTDSPQGNNETEAVIAGVMKQIDDARHGAALRNISKVYSWAGKKEDADRVALRALELIPDDAETVYQAANAYIRLGHLDEGIRLYNRVAELNPNYAVSVHSSLGFAYGLKGDKQRNLEHYLLALNLNPRKYDVHYNVGTIYEDQDDLTNAALHYRLAITGNRHDYSAQYRLGMVYLRQQNWESALTQFAEAARLNPSATEPHIGLGKALAAVGQTQAARSHYVWVLERDPTHPEARLEIDRLK